MTEVIPELIECRPYGARITPRACGLRAEKAAILNKRIPLPPELMGVEKCLTCKDAREAAVSDMCIEAGCRAPAGIDGLCKKHRGINKAKKRRDKTMTKTEDVVDAICKDCGAKASAVEHFSFKSQQCSRCYQRVWAAHKAAAKRNGKIEQKSPLTPVQEKIKQYNIKKTFTSTATGAGDGSTIMAQLIAEMRRRARALIALHAAAQALEETEAGMKVPSIEELMKEVGL